MSTGKPRDPRKEQFWRAHLTRWPRSGLSIRAYCSRHRLAEASFHAWRRTLARRDATTAPAPLTFVPLHLPRTPTPGPFLEVVLGNGRVLRLAPEVPAAVVRDLVVALEERPC